MLGRSIARYRHKLATTRGMAVVAEATDEKVARRHAGERCDLQPRGCCPQVEDIDGDGKPMPQFGRIVLDENIGKS
jgi:hypothetical protein